MTIFTFLLTCNGLWGSFSASSGQTVGSDGFPWTVGVSVSLFMILAALIVSVTIWVAVSFSWRPLGLVFWEMVAVSVRSICCFADGSGIANVVSTPDVKLFVIAGKYLARSCSAVSNNVLSWYGCGASLKVFRSLCYMLCGTRCTDAMDRMLWRNNRQEVFC